MLVQCNLQDLCVLSAQEEPNIVAAESWGETRIPL